jgi:N-acyl-D-amino-acid deacylase
VDAGVMASTGDGRADARAIRLGGGVQMLDLIITGGQVIDGTDAPAFEADVGVSDGRIVEIGRLREPAHRTLAADGLTVTPGWVDIHTHYDGQVTWDPLLAPSTENGVTTALFGNCGVGFAPVHVDRREWLIELMEGVEDIPGSALSEGISWDWQTFPEYLEALGRRAFAIDVGAHIPHGALRGYVMGDRSIGDHAATGDDLADMGQSVKAAGAFGVSTSRTLGHTSISGEPVPGTFAQIDELAMLADVVKRSGHGVMQWAPSGLAAADTESVLSEMERMRFVTESTGCPITFLCLQTNSHPDVWRAQLAYCGDLPGGGKIVAQISPRATGIIACLSSPQHPFVDSPVWRDLGTLPFGARIARLKENAPLRERMALEGANSLARTSQRAPAWNLTYLLSGNLNYEPNPAQSVDAIARREGRDPRLVALELMLRDDGGAFLLTQLMNYAYGDLSPSFEMLSHPHTVASGSDAGAHVAYIGDASMPTFLLTHWSRDRARGPRLPLE